MTRKDLFNYIITSIENIANCKCLITFESKKDNYYHYNEVNTFEIKGKRNWKFGVWIIYSTDTQSYKISMFGQHKWYIDKFKPTYSPIFYEFEVKKSIKKLPIPRIDKNGVNAPNEVWSFGFDINNIILSSFLSRVKYYWNQRSFFNFTLGDWYFYTIKYPLKQWYINYGMIVPLTITKWLYKLKFRNKVQINIYSTRELFSPKWDFQIIYNLHEIDNNEEMYNMYCKINKNYTKLFFPDCVYDGYVNIVNTTDKNDTHRGFYYE